MATEAIFVKHLLSKKIYYVKSSASYAEGCVISKFTTQLFIINCLLLGRKLWIDQCKCLNQ